MTKKLLLAAAAMVAFAMPAHASFLVNGSGVTAIDSGNDFKNDLANTWNLTSQATNYSITVTEAPVNISIFYAGSESALTNWLTVGTSTGTSNFPEADQAWSTADGRLLITYKQSTTGALGNISFYSGEPDGTVGNQLGAGNVAIFLPANLFSDQAGNFGYTSNSLFFGFNDSGSGDSDFDDFVIRMTSSAIPEPATWAMMITGFGLVGVALRRRRTNATAVTA